MGNMGKIKLEKSIAYFEEAIKGKKLPLLPLDAKWHELFSDGLKTKEIRKLEKEINDLLKRQGFLTNEIKDLKKVKATRYEDIVSNMDLVSENEDGEISKVMSKNHELLLEINEKIESYEDELLDIPHRLVETNNKLMILCMDVCYHKLYENTILIEEFNEWIHKVRIELKKNIIRKQNCEIQNQNMYSYMHDILGSDIINIFDMEYLGEPSKNKEE